MGASADHGTGRYRDCPILDDEERAAVARVLAGDHEAFAVLVEKHRSRLQGLSLALLRSPAAAEDLAQDALLRAFERLRSYDPRRPFYPWLARIAVRLAQNRWHREKRQPVSSDQLDRDHELIDRPRESDPFQSVLAEERRRHLWKALAALTTRERVVVVLFYQQELGVNEVARILGVTAGTVKTLLFRARKRLRKALEPRLGGREHRKGE